MLQNTKKHFLTTAPRKGLFSAMLHTVNHKGQNPQLAGRLARRLFTPACGGLNSGPPGQRFLKTARPPLPSANCCFYLAIGKTKRHLNYDWQYICSDDYQNQTMPLSLAIFAPFESFWTYFLSRWQMTIFGYIPQCTVQYVFWGRRGPYQMFTLKNVNPLCTIHFYVHFYFKLQFLYCFVHL